MKTKSIIQTKVQETRSDYLLKCLIKINDQEKLLNCPEKRKIEVLAEINRRFGMPLYVPFVALLCSFLLINREESKYAGMYKYYYGSMSLLILVMAEI